jgi:hypothetical protein
MRKGMLVLAVLASAALAVTANAQSATNSNFVTGYTPQNIVFKPMDFSKNVMPTNINQAMKPQTMGPKVFDISSVFHSIHLPSVTPTRVTGQSLIRPGPGTPIFPKPAIKKN